MVSHHDGIPVTGYAFYSHDTLRRMHLADNDLEASLEESLAALTMTGPSRTGTSSSPTAGLLPHRIDLSRPASWICPPMGSFQEVLISNAGPGGYARIIDLPSCVDDVKVEVRGKVVPVQADRLLQSDGGFILRIGPIELAPFSLLSLRVGVAITTTNTDAFPALPAGSSTRSFEKTSAGAIMGVPSSASGSIENSLLRVEFDTTGLKRVVNKRTGQKVPFQLGFWLYSGNGSNTYSFQPRSSGAELIFDEYRWLSMTGDLQSSIRLMPGTSRLGKGDPTGLAARDVTLEAVQIELSKDPRKAHLLQVSYSGVHLERGPGEAGYNLMVRHPGEYTGCRWSYAENAYEPITVPIVDQAVAGSSFRPMASTMKVACEAGSGGFEAAGSHSRGHVVTGDYVDFMLHRRIPSTPSPDLYHQFTKGDDSSTVSTKVWYDLGVGEALDAQGVESIFREIEVKPLLHRLPSVWEWGMPADMPQRTNLDEAFVTPQLPASVKILHMSVSELSGCDGSSLLLNLYRPLNRTVGSDPVLVDIVAAFARFKIGKVSEQVATMGRDVERTACLRQGSVVALAPNSVCSLRACLIGV